MNPYQSRLNSDFAREFSSFRNAPEIPEGSPVVPVDLATMERLGRFERGDDSFIDALARRRVRLTFSRDCPKWLKEHVESARLLMGDDPVRIGRALKSLRAVGYGAHIYGDRREPDPPLYQTHHLIVEFGETEHPWLVVLPNGGTMNRDELCTMSVEAQ